MSRSNSITAGMIIGSSRRRGSRRRHRRRRRSSSKKKKKKNNRRRRSGTQASMPFLARRRILGLELRLEKMSLMHD